jgi:hypothetical protein
MTHPSRKSERVASTEISPSNAGLAGIKRQISFVKPQNPRVAVRPPAIAAKTGRWMLGRPPDSRTIAEPEIKKQRALGKAV